MSGSIRVIVVNTEEGVAADLRAVLLAVRGVRIVAEIEEPALLAQTLSQLSAEVLLVHLDPNPAAMMDIVAPLIQTYKGQLAAIAMTENRDAELVVRAMRAGMREFLWKPFPPEQLSEILERVGRELPGGGRPLGRLIVVVGTSGGVGATQLATNLAVELAQVEHWDGPTRHRPAPGQGQAASTAETVPQTSGLRPAQRPRVAVVDLDFRFGQVAMQFDAQPTYTIAELCETPEQTDWPMIERAMFKHSTGVHVLARPADLAQAERIAARQAAGVLAALQEHYDFVVVDLPARLDGSARAVFDMTDTCLLVLQLLVPSVRNADRILHELRNTGLPAQRVRLVCNRAGRESGYLEQADVEATLKHRIDFRLPDEWKSSAAAVNMGAPLLTIGPRSKLRHAYRHLALTLAARDEQPEESDPPQASEASRKGLLAFFAPSKG